MTDEELDIAMQLSADVDYILKRVFDLYNINYSNVDYDTQLVLRKMKYVFTEKPPADDAEAK